MLSSKCVVRFGFILLAVWFFGSAPLSATPLNAIVRIESQIAPNARTADSLGASREGAGVVIDNEGHVLTIGYLILEAQSASIIDVNGNAVPATFVGYDSETGFGLLQALTPLVAEPVAFGDSEEVQRRDRLQVVTREEDSIQQEVVVLSRGTFAGYWEYLLEDAIFTTPPVSGFAGAGLFNEQDELLGIGSLFVRQRVRDLNVPANMFVPAQALLPILAELKQGQMQRPAKPWIGVTVMEQFGRVLIERVSSPSPAEAAGLNAGDLILRVNDEPVVDLESLFRTMWRQGDAGVIIPLTVLQGHELREISIQTAARSDYYQMQRYD
jgi:S1-C subfamily serine protease